MSTNLKLPLEFVTSDGVLYQFRADDPAYDAMAEFACGVLEEEIARVENRIEVRFIRVSPTDDDEMIAPVCVDYLCPQCGETTQMIFESADPLYAEPLAQGQVPNPRPCRKCEAA